MHLSRIAHPDRALTVRRLAAACIAHGHQIVTATMNDRARDADVVQVMLPNDPQIGLRICAAYWRYLPPTTGRMMLAAPTPRRTICAYLQSGADGCQPLTCDLEEILTRGAAIPCRCVACPVLAARAVGGVPCGC